MPILTNDVDHENFIAYFKADCFKLVRVNPRVDQCSLKYTFWYLLQENLGPVRKEERRKGCWVGTQQKSTILKKLAKSCVNKAAYLIKE